MEHTQFNTGTKILVPEKMLYVLLASACILYILYKYLNNTYDYWKKRNVPYDEPTTFFGSLWDCVIMKKSLGQVYIDMYNTFKDDPIVGYYKIRQPGLLIREASIVKDILIKDFNNFEKNDIIIDEDIDPIMSKNPFFQYGQRWKVSRSQLSHCFTSGKMRHMISLMDAVAQNMVKYLEREIKLDGNPMDAKELASKFTADNVASCAFGLDGKAFEDPNSEFREVGRLILEPSFLARVKLLLGLLFPDWVKMLKIQFLPEFASNYFKNIVKETLKYRKENNIVRNDFLDVVAQMKFKADVPPLTIDEITAHAVSVFGDGFETSSIAISFLLYDLAVNVGVQEQLRNEINEVIRKHGGQLSYEAIQEMHFLDRALSESLRLHPPALYLAKICTAPHDVSLDNSKILRIETDTPIIIPVYALHHDPKYFPDPAKFDPDRFLDSNKCNIVSGTYLPFGEGPRLCIGMRFASLQVKVAVISIIKNFDVKVNKKTKEPLEINPDHFLLLAKGGLWLDFQKRTE